VRAADFEKPDAQWRKNATAIKDNGGVHLIRKFEQLTDIKPVSRLIRT
jgi:hypothetical protein